MKVYVDRNNMKLLGIEKERPFYTGDSFSSTLTVFFNTQMTQQTSVTLSFLLSNGRTPRKNLVADSSGSTTFDEAKFGYNTWYYYTWNISTKEGILTAPGTLEMTLALTTGQTVEQVKFTNNVVRTSRFGDNENIVVFSDDPEETILDFATNIKTINTKLEFINNIDIFIGDFTSRQAMYNSVFTEIYTKSRSIITARLNGDLFLFFSSNDENDAYLFMVDCAAYTLYKLKVDGTKEKLNITANEIISLLEPKANKSGGNIFTGGQNFEDDVTFENGSHVEINDGAELEISNTQNLRFTDENATLKGLLDSINAAISTIQNKIPSQASASNQLADKDFVNSSIATATATFKGTYNSVNQLPTTNVDINDYAYVISTDALGNRAFDRYKHNGSAWVYEYTLNNSSFTAAQWAAINSGITSEILEALPTTTDLEALEGEMNTLDNASVKSITITFDSSTNEYVFKYLLGSGSEVTKRIGAYISTKADVGLGDVENTGDTNQVIINSNKKFTSGGAYLLQTRLQEYVDSVEATINSDLNGKLNKINLVSKDSIDLNTITESGLYKLNVKTVTNGFSNAAKAHLFVINNGYSTVNKTILGTTGTIANADMLYQYSEVMTFESPVSNETDFEVSVGSNVASYDLVKNNSTGSSWTIYLYTTTANTRVSATLSSGTTISQVGYTKIDNTPLMYYRFYQNNAWTNWFDMASTQWVLNQGYSAIRDADDIDDTNSTNKFVSEAQITAYNVFKTLVTSIISESEGDTFVEAKYINASDTTNTPTLEVNNIVEKTSNAGVTFGSETTFNEHTKVDADLDVTGTVEAAEMVANEAEFGTLYIKEGNTYKPIGDFLNRSYYHLGAYDSVSGNTITRQTGYVDLSNTDIQVNQAWNNLFALISIKLPINAQALVVSNKPSFNPNGSEWESHINEVAVANATFDDDGWGLRITTANQTALADKLRVIKEAHIIIQYKLATSYTEQVIEGRPLNTLDQSGSNWVREEWEKGLNVCYKFEKGNWVLMLYANLKPNTKYTLSTNDTTNAQTPFIKIYDVSYTTLIQTVRENQYGQYLTLSDFTTNSDVNGNVLIRIGISKESTDLTQVMLVEGSHAYPYQEYKGPIVHTTEAFEAVGGSKNLFNNPYYYSATTNGVSINVTGNECILNGTSTNGSYNVLGSITLKAGTYAFNQVILSGSMTGNPNTVKFGLYKSGSLFPLDVSTGTYTLTQDTSIDVVVGFNEAGLVFNYYKLTYMLNEGSTALPHKEFTGNIIFEKDIEPVLLWENSNPENGFVAQTITTADMSKFKYIVIEYKHEAFSTFTTFMKIPYAYSADTFITLSLVDAQLQWAYSRRFNIFLPTAIVFETCYASHNGSSSDDDDWLTPIAIYGTNIL